MRIAKIIGSVVLLSAFVGCYLETRSNDERADGKKKSKTDLSLTNEPSTTPASRTIGDCRLSPGAGCFAAQIASAPDISVAGEKFFDAATFRENFETLLQVKSLDKTRELSNVKIEVISEFDNKTFARDFMVYVKGDRAMNAKVRSQGWFTLENLPDGNYDLRVARPVDFRVTGTAHVTSTSPGGGDPVSHDEEVTKTLCAVIYSDNSIQIHAGEKLSDVYDVFDLFVDDRDCKSTSSGRSISL